ncbi:uncharacterized protein RAG0_11576 [Rhynchosporium agropyri]|uniref:2EXR domain-containing protein n=1 Tax=Rhynchosporium agropyri TaxID=914238 RepID=A0A1E1L4S1_9HELO|nr:uncharacterized protein RAG0_11576 [Rhynchosporium agropyri]
MEIHRLLLDPASSRSSDASGSKTTVVMPGQGGRNLDAEAVDESFPTLTLFPKLSVESRIEIWGHACCVTRNLVLHLEENRDQYYFWSSFQIPEVLRVCQYSSAEAVKHYELDFDVEQSRFAMAVKAGPTIYINWA